MKNVDESIPPPFLLPSSSLHYLQDVEINRFSIGRFIRELLSDLTFGLDESQKAEVAGGSEHSDGPPEVSPQARFLIYGSHDSTLVSLLCAMGVFDGPKKIQKLKK